MANIPGTVTCSKCGAVKKTAGPTYMNRIYKILMNTYHISIGTAKSIPMDDERFIQAQKKHDDEYLCRKCRGPWKRRKTKIPVILDTGEETTDYYDAFPEEFYD